LLSLTDPAARGYAVHGVRDAEKVADTQVRIHGEAERLGPVVPRGFLSAFEVPGAPPVNPTQSGRLELAQWLTSPANPLTPRVDREPRVVSPLRTRHRHNGGQFRRDWRSPFSSGIARSPRSRFVDEGWSMKKLVRTLVLTRAYHSARMFRKAIA
jgi:hypothetical protein